MRITVRQLKETIERILLETKIPTYDEIVAWLIEHYSDTRKLSKPRMEVLKTTEDIHQFLKPPSRNKFLYRGLRNLSKNEAEAVKNENFSNPVKDKSWTLSKEVAWKFAQNEKWYPLETDKFAVVLTAKSEPEKLLFNPDKISKMKVITDFYNKKWKSTIKESIEYEREVLAIKPLQIVDVSVRKNPTKKEKTK